MPHDPAHPELKLGSQLGPQRLGQVAHRLEALGPSFKDPLANLHSAKRRLAALDEPGFQRFPGCRVEQMVHCCIIQPTPRCQSVHRPMSNRKPPAAPRAATAGPAPDLKRAEQLVLELMAIP